ncbi:acyltransferase family protein [Enterobacter mori]
MYIKTGFRKDINGLRAIAVLAVIIFHFNHEWLPGGFAGVDVFFVISGYLMTGIIFRGIEGNNLNIPKFYLARAKRIIPALLAVCVTILIVGWFFFVPIDYADAAKHALSSIFFVSNFVYWSEAGYFDAASLDKVLLHTWSLSAEWQFYILYPVILYLVSKIAGVAKTKKFVIATCIIGFIFCTYSTFTWAGASYFLLPARAWEMLLGGVAYVYPSGRAAGKRWVECLGLALIILSYVFINDSTPWPGYMSAVPVIGAFLIIQSANQSSLITGNVALQYIGKISYSIYLVHWPVIVIANKVSAELTFPCYLLITFVLSAALYYSIENRRKFNFVTIAIVAATSCASFVVITNNGYTERVNDEFKITKEQFHDKFYGGAGYHYRKIIKIGEGEPLAIMSGDSFGLQYAKAIKDNGLTMKAIFDLGCPILPDYSRYRDNTEDMTCSSEYQKLKSMMSEDRKSPVVIAQAWNVYQNLLIKKGGNQRESLTPQAYYAVLEEQLSKVFSDGGGQREYYIIGFQQGAKHNAFSCLASKNLPGYKYLSACSETQRRDDIKVNDALKLIAEKYHNVKFVDPNDALCDSEKCKVIINNQPVHTDQSHLSIYGAAPVVELLKDEILKS